MYLVILDFRADEEISSKYKSAKISTHGQTCENPPLLKRRETFTLQLFLKEMHLSPITKITRSYGTLYQIELSTIVKRNKCKIHFLRTSIPCGMVDL